MTQDYHSGDLRAVTDPGSFPLPTDLPYRPPVPGLPSTPPTAPVEEPPLPPAGDPPIGDPPPPTPVPSPVTF
ncbi:MAG: hypothetical protein IAI49_16560 [Candidatus Eremiobacteraeota bacterium]|nr:hypothetical protein [Candidatus Eremiobacteraeota bacterium]